MNPDCIHMVLMVGCEDRMQNKSGESIVRCGAPLELETGVDTKEQILTVCVLPGR